MGRLVRTEVIEHVMHHMSMGYTQLDVMYTLEGSTQSFKDVIILHRNEIPRKHTTNRDQ